MSTPTPEDGERPAGASADAADAASDAPNAANAANAANKALRVAFAWCAGLPVLGGVLMRFDSPQGMLVSLAAPVVWCVFLVLAVSAMSRGAGPKGRSYLLGV